MNDTPADFMIVGQGLAGSLLGYLLEREGKSVVLIDHPDQTAATSVAAGIINPITGRRFVKSWRIDELLPVARQLYRELEAELGLSFWHEYPLLRTLFNRGDQNDWLARTGEAAYAPYMAETAELGPLIAHTQPAFAYGQVRRAAQVDIGSLRQALRRRWINAGKLHLLPFDYDRLQIESGSVAYESLHARRLVFCEGWRLRFNPYFNYLPWGGNKGEALIARIPDAHFDRILKHRVFIVPLHEDHYWIGATSDNKFSDDQPSPENRQFLAKRLSELLTASFEIVEHRAAVRPTVKDRRPLLGAHPDFSQLYIFNGLGTKGASLAPFFAHQLADYLLGRRTELDENVAISRFSY